MPQHALRGPVFNIEAAVGEAQFQACTAVAEGNQREIAAFVKCEFPALTYAVLGTEHFVHCMVFVDQQGVEERRIGTETAPLQDRRQRCVFMRPQGHPVGSDAFQPRQHGGVGRYPYPERHGVDQ